MVQPFGPTESVQCWVLDAAFPTVCSMGTGLTLIFQPWCIDINSNGGSWALVIHWRHHAEFEDNRLLLYILVCKAWFCWLVLLMLARASFTINLKDHELTSDFVQSVWIWPPSSPEQMLAIKTAGETGGKRAMSHILVEEQYFVQSDLWSGWNQRVANPQCKWLLQQSQGWSLAYIRFFDCPLWKEMRTLTSPGI